MHTAPASRAIARVMLVDVYVDDDVVGQIRGSIGGGKRQLDNRASLAATCCYWRRDLASGAQHLIGKRRERADTHRRHSGYERNGARRHPMKSSRLNRLRALLQQIAKNAENTTARPTQQPTHTRLETSPGIWPRCRFLQMHSS